MVKAVTLAYSNSLLETLETFVRAKFSIPNFPQATDGGISNFEISGQSLINKNVHNSGTSDDIDMILGPIITTYKAITKAQKQFDTEIVLKNCDVIVFFLIYA